MVRARVDVFVDAAQVLPEAFPREALWLRVRGVPGVHMPQWTCFLRESSFSATSSLHASSAKAAKAGGGSTEAAGGACFPTRRVRFAGWKADAIANQSECARPTPQ